MTARLDTGTGDWSISGEISFETVPALYEQANEAFTSRLPGSIDLQAVERVDSAGVALMLEWIRVLRAQGQSLKFRNIPQHMISIAELCGVNQLFGD